jgi:hypothetical protein
MKPKHRTKRAFLVVAMVVVFAGNVLMAQTTDHRERDSVYRVIEGNSAPNGETESLLWVRWRENSIELQDPSSNLGFVYQRLRGGRLELFQLFHVYKTAIRYELRDAWLFDETADFANEVQFWDGSLLDVLIRREGGNREDGDTVEYFGTVDNAKIELLWLEAEQIPARIRISTPSRVVSFERLSDRQAVPAYNWPEWEDSYEDIDFVDLGDREEHPVASLIHAEHH